MAESSKIPSPAARFATDYWMIFVLLLLAALISLLTIESQHPSGADAGREVADRIIKSHGNSARVLIVTRDTALDRQFAAAAVERLQEVDSIVLGNVNGLPADVREAIESILASGDPIDAIAANDVTAQWNVYDRFPTVGRSKCVTPNPYYWPNFLKMTNLLGVANQTAIYAIIAIGMTMVIVTAGIDLSVGSLVALSAVCTARTIRDFGGGTEAGIAMVVCGCVVGIAVCTAAGAFNGFVVTAFRIPPFIVTLSMMLIARGLAYRFAGGQSISELPTTYSWLGGQQTLGIPNPVLLMVVLYIIAHVVMSRMVFGRYVYAIGGNSEAARLSGVPVKRVMLAAYTICGALAGLVGVVLSSQLDAGDPKFGQMYELDVIAAVVVGGTSLMGGEGKIFKTLVGAFIIAIIKNGMNLMKVHPFDQMPVLGAVLLVAVLIDTLKRRGLSS